MDRSGAADEGFGVRRGRLTSPTEIKKIMERHGFAFSKSLGQNFLIDEHAVDRIIETAEQLLSAERVPAEKPGRRSDSLIIEIGPGFGVLTERLCAIAEKVIAVEKDKTLLPILRELIPSEHLEIVSRDVLTCDIDRMIVDAGYESAVAVANLPYYITTPIVMKILEEAQRVRALVIMMQKEVADRILDLGDRGAITMSAAYYAESSRIAVIGRNSFMPAPKVDSAVVKMIRIPPKLDAEQEEIFKRIVRAIYSSRRKTLKNSLTALNLCDKNRLSDVIIQSGYAPTVRGETLDLEDLLLLAKTVTALEER